MNNRTRYTRQNVVSNNFYQLPKFLFDAEFRNLSNDARVLYALLRNRHEISIKNEWYDENGEVYLYFKRDEMQSTLLLSDKTITKAMKDLKNNALVEEQRQGFAAPNKIYLLTAIVQPFGIGTPDTIPVKFTAMEETAKNQHTRNIYGTETVEFTARKPQDLRLYNNQNNKSQNNNNQSSQSVNSDLTETIKQNIDYHSFTISHAADIELIDEIILIMIDCMLSKGEYVRIKGEDKPRELVKSVLLKLDYWNIEHAVAQFKGITKPITDKQRYLLSLLYNSKAETASHMTNLVISDLHEQ